MVCFHFRFTSMKDWKIMYIFSAKKKKSIREVIHQPAAEKEVHSSAASEIKLLGFFFPLSLA